MTDHRDAAPLAPPLTGAADRALRDLAALSRSPGVAGLQAGQLLEERARLLELSCRPRQSAGGFCRLLDTADGVIAVNLPRAADWELLPAWLQVQYPITTWHALTRAVRQQPATELQARARLLGLPAAAAVEPARRVPPFRRVVGRQLAPPPRPASARPPRVIDLSALWAGPLCGHLLQRAGAHVIKVESVDRPDGARHGNVEFYGLLNQGKRCVALDFRSSHGQRALLGLIRSADIVIEAARPRALQQLGVDARTLLQECPALTWVSITGYGRGEPEGNWVAFGDDAGVSAGLAQAMRHATGDVQFLGDAVADPLTGIQAALAAWQSWCTGGGRLVTLALADVAAASLAAAQALQGPDALRRSLAAWWEGSAERPSRADAVRRITAPVHALGADTAAVLTELAVPC